MHAANAWAFPRAERVFTLSAAMADQLKPYFRSTAQWHDRVVVIPPWADTGNMHPSLDKAVEFRYQYAISGLVLSYSGNMGLTHPLEILVEAAFLFEQMPSFRPVQVLLIGNGPKRNKLQRQASALQLPPSRLRFLDRLPYGELAASLSATDLAVVALDGPSSASSLPSKTFNALACGTPLLVLAAADSALAQLVQEYRCGLVIEPGPAAPQQLVDAVVYLDSHPEELHQLADNALAAASHYTPANAERLLDDWLGPLPAL
jgi:glycosyltransferase involved in cell wall biosynthesis